MATSFKVVILPMPGLHRSYKESNAREIASSRIAFNSFVTVCWIEETAWNLIPYKAIFNLGNKRSQPALNRGSGVDGITRDPSFCQKLGENIRRRRRCIVVQKISGPTLLKLRLNAMNWSDQFLIHLFIKFTVDSLFFGHKFMMNDTFSIKNAVNIIFTSDFCILTF
jgi:hypothetical protein